MADYLDQDLTTTAFLWRLERRDGVAIGFTNHDRDLVRAGFVYRATPGLVPSAIERSTGFDAGSVELSGALTSDAITHDDLFSGRWDGALLLVSLTDWTDAAALARPLLRGSLGTVDISDGAFSAELRGIAHVLDMPAVEDTSPACRATLGDKRCRVDLASLHSIGVITAVSGDTVTLATALADGAYAAGRARWLDGPNSGLTSRITSNGSTTIMLREPPPFPVTAGTRLELLAGCDRLFSTCVGRFANGINFQGEPHVPGNDLLTRYAS